MGKSCGMCREIQKCPQGFGGKCYGYNHFEDRRKGEDIIKTNLTEIGEDGMVWIHPAKDRDKRRAVVNTAVNLTSFYSSQLCFSLVYLTLKRRAPVNRSAERLTRLLGYCVKVVHYRTSLPPIFTKFPHIMVSAPSCFLHIQHSRSSSRIIRHSKRRPMISSLAVAVWLVLQVVSRVKKRVPPVGGDSS